MSRVAIRLEVADDAPLPQALSEGQVKGKEEKNSSAEQAEDSSSRTAHAIGQRQMKQLSVETYTPS